MNIVLNLTEQEAGVLSTCLTIAGRQDDKELRRAVIFLDDKLVAAAKEAQEAKKSEEKPDGV